MDTMTLPISPKNHLKRTYSDTRLETPLPDSVKATTPLEAPVKSTLESSTKMPLMPSQPVASVTVPDSANPLSHPATPFNATNAPAATTTPLNPAKKRTKLTESEKEVKRLEKEAKELEKANQKAKKEEEKIRKEEEKAKKDEERRAKDAEKEKKRQEKEEQARVKEEEKRKKEDEKEKKHKVGLALPGVGFMANDRLVSNASQRFLCSPEFNERWIDYINTPGEPIACQ
ncbi:MAG: hypothetical protein L6R42_010421 [Xanthoria sp. 1 TBL-2021]|nr:MAG: hypothetical protein L6R42_010421 [Xanthoria sp. 1 TBL-2021]